MSKRAVVVVGVLVLAAGAAGAYYSLRSAMPDFGESQPHRDLTPRGVAYYAEAKDLKGLWDRAKGTDAWKDLVGSKFVSTLLESPAVKDVLAALDQASKKVDYPLDGDNAMKFIGRETAFAVSLPESGPPEMLLLARLDVDALTKDLLARRAGWRELMDEIAKRSGKLDFQVTTSEHSTPGGKLSIARLERDGRDTYLALCGETLVLSTDGALCRSVLDLHGSGGKGGLSSDSRFRDETAKFPGTPALLEWLDLDLLSSRRSAVVELLRKDEAPPPAVAAVEAVLAGIEGGGSVARATDVPDGNLYAVRWKWSKSTDMFADRAAPPVSDLFDGQWIAYSEWRGAGRVIDAWDRSALRRKLGAGEIGKQIDKFLDDPAGIIGSARQLAGMGFPGGMADLDEMEDEEEDMDEDGEEDPGMPRPHRPVRAGGPASPEAVLDRFTVKMGAHLLATQLDAVFAGDAAFAVDWVGTDDALPRVAIAVRLDVDGRLAALAIEGAALEGAKEAVETSTHGGRKVRSVVRDLPEGIQAHWAFVGDVFVAANDLAFVRAAIDAASGTAPKSGRRGEAAKQLQPGWCWYAHGDFERLRAAIGRRPEDDMVRRMFLPTLDAYLSSGTLPAHSGYATYVPDDLSGIDMRVYSVLQAQAPGTSPVIRPDGDPSWRKSLPEETFLYGGGFMGFVDLWKVLGGVLSGTGMEISEAEEEFRKAFGMDLSGELLPSLGDEWFFAMTHRKARATSGGPPGQPPMAIPGFVIGMAVRDEKTVRTFVDRSLGMIQDAARQNDPSRELFAVEQHSGVPVQAVRFTPDEEGQVPVRPALSLAGGWLVISTEAEEVHRVIDGRQGRVQGLAASPVYARASKDVPARVSAETFIDCDKALDQVKEMLPMMSAFAPGAGSSVPFPDFPEDGDQDEWNKRMEKYQKDVAKARESGTAEIAKWIDACRLVDHVRSWSNVEGLVRRDEYRIRFTD